DRRAAARAPPTGLPRTPLYSPSLPAARPTSTIAANSPTSQPGTAGAAVASPPSVLVKDANGNPVSGVAVTFSATGANGTVNPATPVEQAGGGEAPGHFGSRRPPVRKDTAGAT